VHHLGGAQVHRYQRLRSGGDHSCGALDAEAGELVLAAGRQPVGKYVKRSQDGSVGELPPDERLRPARLARGKRDYGLVLETQFGKAWSAALWFGKAHAQCRQLDVSDS